MFKIIVSLFVFMSVSFCANDDTYVFEAKGKFAKDLKALVEKYSKDGKIDVKVIKTSPRKNDNKNKSFISALIGHSGDSADLELGKKVYTQNCIKCHGVKADKNTYVGGKTLKQLTKDEIVDEVENYRRSITYGGTMRYVMYNSVDSLSDNDINSVAVYIKNLGRQDLQVNSQKQVDMQEAQEESGSYLQ